MAFDADVVIVGAGVAGLSAARLLGRFGLRCLILEGSELLGGRVRTLRRAGWQIPIELGAEFVHGRPAPTLALDGGAVKRVHVPEHRGEIVEGRLRPMVDTWQRLAQALRGADHGPDDETVAEYLRRAALPESEQRLVRQIVEGYHAAELDAVSARDIAKDAAASAGDFQQFRTSNGYDQVIAELEHGLASTSAMVRLMTRVHAVSWTRHAVRVQATSPEGPFTVSGRCCLVTCSIGVLQAGSIRFDPEPLVLHRALPLLAMGQVVRMVLRMQQAPWPGRPGEPEPSFVHVADALFPTLWREARAGQQQITAWAAGPQAKALSGLSEESLIDAALRSLAKATNASVGECHAALLAAHHHDYNRDPLTLGAYSYARPGGREAAADLREPTDDTLFFAGEALDLEYPGTVAGALGSGQHVARQVIERLGHEEQRACRT